MDILPPRRKDKELEFIIAHRFGRVNTGFEQLFGLDQSNIRFSFEYGLSDDLTAGLGRSSFEKTYDGYLKYRLLKQKKGKNSFPFAVSLFGSIAAKSQKAVPGNERTFEESLFYVGQVLIAKKVNSSFSVQVTPTYVHRNLTAIAADPHDIFALGFGTRVKLNTRVSLNAEYFQQFDKLESISSTPLIGFWCRYRNWWTRFSNHFIKCNNNGRKIIYYRNNGKLFWRRYSFRF